MKITQYNNIPNHMMKWKRLFFLFLFIGITSLVSAADADVKKALSDATSSIQGYFDGASKLVFAISAIVGLIGAIKVYSKWNSGDQDTQKVAAAWFGACIFLVVVATVIKTFFGITSTPGGTTPQLPSRTTEQTQPDSTAPTGNGTS